MYNVLVKFKRTFTRGSLKGITIEGSIKHVDMTHAINWVEGIKNKPLDYELSDFEFVNL